VKVPGAPLELALKQGEKELLFALEVRIKRASGKARATADGLDRSALQAGLSEHVCGGLE